VSLILGDNIFYGQGFQPILLQAVKLEREALVFGYWVSDPECYGVLEFDKFLKVLSIKEKPRQPKSNYAVVGLYFYDNHVVEIASSLKPSARGELEITDLNREYLMRGDFRSYLAEGLPGWTQGLIHLCLRRLLMLKPLRKDRV
jgi:glucose-1-phosphate thymidylyltransferase